MKTVKDILSLITVLFLAIAFAACTAVKGDAQQNITQIDVVAEKESISDDGQTERNQEISSEAEDLEQRQQQPDQQQGGYEYMSHTHDCPVDESQFEVLDPIDAETEKIVSECNALIYAYFLERKEIDVSYELSTLAGVYFFSQKSTEDDGQLLGLYDPTVAYQPNIYLNEFLVDDVDLLKFTYVHEIMHLLGFVDNETIMVMEGLSDCMAEEILGYCYTDSYDVPRELSHQLLIADPDLISYIINRGDVDDRIDRFAESSYEGCVPSQVLDYLLYEIEYYNLDDCTYSEYIDECQEIISSYCNSFELSDEQLEEIESYWRHSL